MFFPFTYTLCKFWRQGWKRLSRSFPIGTASSTPQNHGTSSVFLRMQGEIWKSRATSSWVLSTQVFFSSQIFGFDFPLFTMFLIEWLRAKIEECGFAGITPESESFSDKGFGAPPTKWKGTCGRYANFSGCNKWVHCAFIFSKKKPFEWKKQNLRSV